MAGADQPRPRDGVLTKASAEQFAKDAASSIRNRTFWYFGAKSFDNVPSDFSELGTFFCTLIVCEASKSDTDAAYEMAARLIHRGNSYVCCWGLGCNLVETQFDMFYVCDEAGESKAGHSLSGTKRFLFPLITTSHAEEPLREAVWYFLHVVLPHDAASHTEIDMHEPWPCTDWLAIVIGKDEWKDEVWGYMRDPQSVHD